MLTRLRRRLGKLKDRLELRVETMSSGRRRSEQPPLNEADKEFMLGWVTGKIDDAALIARARSTPGGLALVERACAARPANALVCAARAELCLDAENPFEAIDHAERAYVLGRLEPQTGHALVRALIAVGRGSEALAIIPPALENARRLSAHGIRLALCAMWRDLEPDSIEPLLEEARTYVATGEPAIAMEKFEQLVPRFGPRASILLPLGAVYQDTARTGDALKAYLKAVEAEPGNTDALCVAGDSARDSGDVELADRLLSKAIELDPHSAFARFNLGLLRLDAGRIDEAADLLLGARAVNRGEPWTAEDVAGHLARTDERNIGDADWACARYKLVHDIEQFEYLRDSGKVGPEIQPVIEGYRAALNDPILPKDAGRMVALNPEWHPMLARAYKQPLHAPDPRPPAGPLVNPDLDWRRIEERYFDSQPNCVYIDGLLTPEALAALRGYCLESTIWNELKGGYLGAYMQDGFSGRLLLRIASELRTRMPRTLQKHAMQTMWAYKYDSHYAGIGVHGDVAAVNVNFWVTPDEANLDPERGGLVVYSHDAPRSWSLKHFNHDHERIYAYLESVQAKKQVIAYRSNRAVIFDSDLFHETDAFRFKEGYENRRVNVTMLYGTRSG